MELGQSGQVNDINGIEPSKNFTVCRVKIDVFESGIAMCQFPLDLSGLKFFEYQCERDLFIKVQYVGGA